MLGKQFAVWRMKTDSTHFHPAAPPLVLAKLGLSHCSIVYDWDQDKALVSLCWTGAGPGSGTHYLCCDRAGRVWGGWTLVWSGERVPALWWTETVTHVQQ